MASQPPPNNPPAAEQLWQSFISYCKKINAGRCAEDAPDSRVRAKELGFFQNFGAEDNSVYKNAQAWDEGLAAKHTKRSNEDLAIVKVLFDQALAMGRKDALDSMGMGGDGELHREYEEQEERD